jgi:chemotaxis methyl-accepting protein methylase
MNAETRWQRIEEYAGTSPGREPYSLARMIAYLCAAVLELRRRVDAAEPER